MIVHLPNSAFLGNIEAFLSRLDFSDSRELNISLNPKWVSVHPAVLSATAAIAEEYRQNNLPIKTEEVTSKSSAYFVRMGLYQFLGLGEPKGIVSHEESGRFIPLRKIASSDELGHFIADMIPLLHGKPENVDPIRYVVSELIRNVLEHSSSSIGAIICAQYFKKTKRISIGVADRGIGITKSISVSHRVKDDLHALNLALRPGLTGKTAKIGGTEDNAGAGLFFTRNIAKASRNYFFIYSGKAYYKLLTREMRDSGQAELFSDPFYDPCTVRDNVAQWNGTIVGIDIAAEGGRHFSKLLAQIREAYSVDVKSQKKKNFKKPRFL